MVPASSMLHRLQTARDKFGWGLRVVGPAASLAGLGRFFSIRVRRPDRSEVHLRSGPVLEFDYPRQFPPTLMIFGDFIDPEFDFLKRVARPGWLVVDVGAAIGQFTAFTATCLPDAIVHAFEPSSANVATLRRNITRNRVEGRVAIHHEALADHAGTAQFETTSDTWNSGLVRDGADHGNTEIVTLNTLDAGLDELGIAHLNVLKVNVAGFEPAVLDGAMRTLSEGRVDILILLLGLASLPYYATIAALGYRCFYYHPGEQSLFEVTEFDEASVLNHRPWPARHLIVIRAEALPGLLAGLITVQPAKAGP